MHLSINIHSYRVIIELIFLVQFVQCSELTVNTTCGLLKGTEFKSRNGRVVTAFHGIPFAKPPVGKLRFQVCIVTKNMTPLRRNNIDLCFLNSL